jgi:hypothetical protein
MYICVDEDETFKVLVKKNKKNLYAGVVLYLDGKRVYGIRVI